MNSNHELIAELLARNDAKQPLDEEERRVLEAWFEEIGEHRVLRNWRAEEQWLVKQAMDHHKRPAMRMQTVRLIIGVAAAVFVAGWGLWLLMHSKVGRPTKVAERVEADRLELSDGTIINLNGLLVGSIISRRGVCVISMADSHVLVFHRQKGVPGNEGWYRVFTGKQDYQLQMPDESVVSLRAGSSLTFPQEGRISDKGWKLSGKAHLQIEKDPRRPLLIQLPHHETIQVLGTTLIVEATEEDPESRVCLLSGLVRLRNLDDSVVLRPNQMAKMSLHRLVVKNMRDSSVMGWTPVETPFHFDHTPLAEALRQVSAWYGYTVNNQENVCGVVLTGEMPKSDSLEKVLTAIRTLETGHARLDLRAGEIVVRPPY